MAELPPEEVAKVEAFLVAYNTIDRELRNRLKLGRNISFRSAVDRYASRHPWWRKEAEALHAFAELRNVVVHERFDSFSYISVPAAAVIEEIERIQNGLISPKLVEQVAMRDVHTVQAEQPLDELLDLVHEHGINQLPVMDGREFLGLITSKGVLSWLAAGAAERGSVLNLSEVPVRRLLELEGSRHNCDFVHRKMPVDEASFLFARNPQLEALLVTEHGRRDQGLIGIMTQRDATRLFD